MMIKVIVLALILVAINGQYYDQYGNYYPYNTTNSGHPDYSNDTRYGYMNDMHRNQTIARIVVWSVFGLGCLIVSIVLLYKCVQKRNASKLMKTQMAHKKLQFAASLGLNLYELNNDRRLSYTFHAWLIPIFIFNSSYINDPFLIT